MSRHLLDIYHHLLYNVPNQENNRKEKKMYLLITKYFMEAWMAIQVNGDVATRARVERLLQQICSLASVDDATGQVTMPSGSLEEDEDEGCKCLWALINHNRTVTIIDLPGPNSVVPDSGGRTIGQVGGGAISRGPGATLQPDGSAGPGSDSTVYIDSSSNNDLGYHGFDTGGNIIDASLFIILAHELCTGHAFHNANGTAETTSAGRETQAISHENRIRAEKQPPYHKRTGHGAGPNTRAQWIELLIKRIIRYMIWWISRVFRRLLGLR